MPTPEAAPAPAPVWAEPPPPVEPAPVEETSSDAPWYDALTISAFADAYLSFDLNFPMIDNNPVRAYDADEGFSLAWVGLDLAYDADVAGGTLALRFGPEAERLGAGCEGGRCDSEYGLSVVKQGYATFRPGGAEGGVSLDIGKFDTPYGAEVAESQLNINYTRGVLYWLGQPAYHTGFRLGADVNRNLSAKLLLVNGWNRAVDNNQGKTAGVQGTFRVPESAGSDQDMLSVSVGYMVGPEQADVETVICGPDERFDIQANPDTGCVSSPGSPGDSGAVDRSSSNSKGLRHFLDLTLLADPTPQVRLALNGSYGIEKLRSPTDLTEFESKSWYGVMAAARYAVSEAVGIGARGEYFGDPDGHRLGFEGNSLSVVSGTLTLDYLPVDALLLRLDGRVDWSDKEIFPKDVRELTGTAVSVALGAVVTTD